MATSGQPKVMNVADILILAVLALSVLFGLLRGFVSEVLSLVCWVAAFWVAWAFGSQVADFYASWLHEPAARLVAGYVTCFVGVLVVGALVGWMVHRLMAHGGLRGGDRFLGMLFGFARGVVLLTFVVLMLGFTTAPRSGWWRQSMLLPPFQDGAGWLAGALPPDVTQHLEWGGRSLSALSEIPISTLQRAAHQLARPAGAASTGARVTPAASSATAGSPQTPDGVGK